MATDHAPEVAAAGGAGLGSGPPPAVLSWPLPGCHSDSLYDLFSACTVAELACAAGLAGGAVVLELGGHTLHAPAGGRPGWVHLLEGQVPPAGLRSLALRNGTLALRPGTGLAFSSNQPFAVSLERVKVTRPAPVGSGSGAGAREALAAEDKAAIMVAFDGAVSGRMVQCRVELSPAGPGGNSVGVGAQKGARVVLEDVDVVARLGAGCGQTVACHAITGGRLELNRCAGCGGAWCAPLDLLWGTAAGWDVGLPSQEGLRHTPARLQCRLALITALITARHRCQPALIIIIWSYVPLPSQLPPPGRPPVTRGDQWSVSRAGHCKVRGRGQVVGWTGDGWHALFMSTGGGVFVDTRLNWGAQHVACS
jgi:hypothetical protein